MQIYVFVEVTFPNYTDIQPDAQPIEVEVHRSNKRSRSDKGQGAGPGDITTYQQNLVHNLRDLGSAVNTPEDSDDGMCNRSRPTHHSRCQQACKVAQG